MSVEKKLSRTASELGFALFSLVGLYYLSLLLSRGAGVFIGSLRADELHLLQNSWMEYAGQPALEYIPPLYHYLLTFFWRVWGGDPGVAYVLRFLNFLMFCLQGFLIYRIFLMTFEGLRGRYFFMIYLILSGAFLIFLAGFRGYEIRPEGLGNTSLLVGLYWLFRGSDLKLMERRGSFLAICLVLVAAASLSLRFVLPAFFLWVAVVVQVMCREELTRRQKAVLLAQAFAVSIAAAFVADYLFMDWGHALAGVLRYSSTTAPMDAYTRFTINAWLSYGTFCIWVLSVVGLLAGYTMLVARKVQRADRLVTALLFFSAVSFYVFLFVWDINPRAYIHSIEWVLILGLFLYSVRTTLRHLSALALALVIGGGSIAHLGYKGAHELSADRNSMYFLYRSLNAQALAKQKDSILVKHFDIDASLIEQVDARREFCARHRGSLVIAGSILYHPLCLVDTGSYDFSGWGHQKVDWLGLPSDKELIVLAASPEQLASLASFYGRRYMAESNIAFIRKSN